MADQLHLEIVTPEGLRLSEQVNELTAPSVAGEFGVLPGHLPVFCALATGIVSYVVRGERHRVAVGPGFVEVADDHAVLLTDRFMTKDALDPVRVRLDLKHADEKLDRFDGDPSGQEYLELVEAEQWAAIQLELHGDPPPPLARTISRLHIAPHDLGLAEGITADEIAEEPKS